MRQWILFITLISLIYTISIAPSYSQIDSNIIVINNANVIPMDSMRILEDVTVIISNGLIQEICPSESAEIPSGAFIIDAKNKYLIPGLTDMHVHIWDTDYFINFLANGVTTVRNMWGESQHLAWREQIRNGSMLGPELYTTGPILEGEWHFLTGSRIILTKEEARNIVRQNKNDGYNFIKIYHTILNKEVYDEIISEAANQNISVVGHPAFVTDSMWTNLEHAFNSGVSSIEHMHWYLAVILNMPNNLSFHLWNDLFTNEIDTTIANELINLQLQGGTWVCPTLVTVKNYTTTDEYLDAKNRPYMKYVKSNYLDGYWSPAQNNVMKLWDPGYVKEYRKNIATKKIIKLMHDLGVRLLVGTDCANPFVVWGFSIHEEFELFIEAGFTPFEVLTIATKDAAEFMNAEHIFGTIKEGLRADLLLLNNNPLDNITNLQDRVGVIVRGKWLTEEFLQSKLNETFNITEIKSDHTKSFIYKLSQNYPNPFNPSTIIKYSLAKQSNVTLKVFDVLGREIVTLIDKEQQQGNYEIEFDASTSSATGSELSSGIYFYKLTTEKFIETKKMLLIK